MKRYLAVIVFWLSAVSTAFALYPYPAPMNRNVAVGGGPVPVVSQNFLTTPTLPAWLDVSGITGNRMMYDSTGTLTYAPNNLLTYSNTLNNVAWSNTSMTVASGATDPLSGTNAWTLTATGANAIYYQTFGGGISGVNYLSTVWIKRRTGTGTVQLRLPDNATYTNVTVTASWTQVYVVGAATASGNINFVIRLVTSGDAVDVYAPTFSAVTYETSVRSGDQVITTSAVYYGPRFDNPNAVANGLLIEESRTNIALSSNNFTTPWNIAGSTITANSTTSVDGTTNASKLASSATASQTVGTYQAIGTTAQVYTGSIYAKSLDYNYLAVSLVDFSGNRYAALFNTTTAAFVTSNSVNTPTSPSYAVTQLSNGWVRIAVTMTFSGSGAGYMQVGLSSSSSPTWTSNLPVSSVTSGLGMYIYGAQLEAGAFATSYVPTLATSVTRSADIINLAGTALTTTTGGPWSAVVESTLSVNAVANQFLASTSNSAGKNFGAGYRQSVSKPWFSWAANSLTNGSTISVTNDTTVIRNAFSVNYSGSANLSANGGPVVSSGACDYTGSNTGALLGSAASSTYFINGHIRGISLYSSMLSNTALQIKSVVGSNY